MENYQTSTSTAVEKQSTNFDLLSREELLKKCKHYLQIAKKAKAAKDDALEEVKRLKQELLQHSEKSQECSPVMEALSPAHQMVDGKSQIMLMQNVIDQNSSKIKSLIQENSELKSRLMSPDFVEQSLGDQNRTKNQKLFMKLKLYREKIESLRAERDELRTTTNDYSVEVSDFLKALTSAASKMIDELRQKSDQTEALKKEVDKLNKLLLEEKEARARSQAKKTSVLDLEIAAYEKTLNDLNKKLESKTVEVNELQAIINDQNTNKQIETLSETVTALRNEIDELKVQNAKCVSDLQESNNATENENKKLIQAVKASKLETEKFKSLSTMYESDIESLRSEYELYKVRAQGVLRQNQTKINLDEQQELRDKNLMLQDSIESLQRHVEKLEANIAKFKLEAADYVLKIGEMQQKIDDLLKVSEKQSEDAIEEMRSKSRQHDESIKSYQLQIDTLNTFYKNKIRDDEVQNELTIAHLKNEISKLEEASRRVPVLNEYQQMEESFPKYTIADRQEAEGSENTQPSIIHSQRRKISKGREIMPLDELLNSSFDFNPSVDAFETLSNFSSPSDELEQTKLELTRELNRVAHLTALLADSEKDLAKFQQMNDMLKEEVRRQQRNSDREEHTLKNSEYLKNVVLKFVSSHSSDEKQRLIPVLNTILSLSLEENTMLVNSCKTGWTGLWSK